MLDFFSVQRGGCVCKTCGKRIDGLSDLGAIFVKDKNRIQTEVYCKKDTPQGGGGDVGNLVSISVLPTTGVYETGVTTHPGEMPSTAPEFRIHMVANFDSGMSIPLNFNNTADKAAIDKLVGTVLRAYGKPYDIIPTLPEVKYDTVGEFFYVDQEAHTKTETGADVVYQERVELKFTDLVNTPVAAEAKLLDGWTRVDELVDDDFASVLSVEGNYPTTMVTFDSKSPIPTKVLPIDFKLDTSAIKAQAIDPTYTLKTYPDTHPLYPGQQYLEIYSHAKLLYGTQVVVADFKNAIPVEYPLEADKVIDHVEFKATNVSIVENEPKLDADAFLELKATIDGAYYIYYENIATPEAIPMNKAGQAPYQDPNQSSIVDLYLDDIRHIRWTDPTYAIEQLPIVAMDDPQPESEYETNATIWGPSVFEVDLRVDVKHQNEVGTWVPGGFSKAAIEWDTPVFEVRARLNSEERIAYHESYVTHVNKAVRDDHTYLTLSVSRGGEKFISDITGDTIAISDNYISKMEFTNQGTSYDGGTITLTDGSEAFIGDVTTTKFADIAADLFNIINSSVCYGSDDEVLGTGPVVLSPDERNENDNYTRLNFTLWVPDPTFDKDKGDTNRLVYTRDFYLLREKIDTFHNKLGVSMDKVGDHYVMKVNNDLNVYTGHIKDKRVKTDAKTFDETLVHKASTHPMPDGSTHTEPSLHSVLVGVINAIQDTEQYTSSLIDKGIAGISVDPTMYAKKSTASNASTYNWVETTAELIVPDPSWSRSDSSHTVANRNLLDDPNRTIKVLMPSRVVARWTELDNPEPDKLSIGYNAKLDLTKDANAAWNDSQKTSDIDEAPIVLDSTMYPDFVNQLMELIQDHYGYHLQNGSTYAKFVDADGNPMKGIQVATDGMNDTEGHELIDATVIVPNPAFEGADRKSTVMANAIEVPVQVWVPKGGKDIETIEFIQPVDMNTIEYNNLDSSDPWERNMVSPEGFRYRIHYTDGSTLDITGSTNDTIFPMPEPKKITRVQYRGYVGTVEYHSMGSSSPDARYMTCDGYWVYLVTFNDGTTEEVHTPGTEGIWPMPVGQTPSITDVEFMGPSNGDWNGILYENLTDEDPRNRKMRT